MKSSFILHGDYKEQIDLLTDEQAGQLFKAIFEYETTGEIPDMEAVVRIAFGFIKAQLDRDADKYEEICDKRREAGKQGGRPKANGFSEKAKKANGFSEKQTKANESKQKQKNPDNDNDGDSEDVDVDVNDSEGDKVKGITPLNPPKGKTRTDLMLDAFKRFLPDHDFSPGMISAIEDWATYKIEKKQQYTETGVMKLLEEIDRQRKAHGEMAVINIIDQTMASGYQGITWDKISKVKPVESTADRVRKVDDYI